VKSEYRHREYIGDFLSPADRAELIEQAHREAKHMKTQFYDPKMIALLKKQMYLSPSTAHKLANPFCGKCIMERGKQFLANLPCPK
jgi:hypothetical protein